VILLDSHIVLATLGLVDIPLTPTMRRVLEQPDGIFVSVASVWELAIKHRLGKLRFSVPADQIPDLLERLNIQVLPIQAYHAFANVGPEPTTKDPFDRLLLGVCASEKMKLMTFDKDLVDHPLAWHG
jgi:PIN domain nuclease of toxin-antitoxin system